MKTIAVQLTDIGKQYEIHHEKPTLVEKFVKGKTEIFWALRNINLTIYKGDQVGIIGPNGSGKTTLLKIICGITSPTCGTIHVQGKVVSLIDLQAGFHPDLSGYQNIFINGMILGLRKEQIMRKIRAIISFADIRQFIDAPLYTYSSGMILRLGFAIVAYSRPSVIIIDESINVGDAEFRTKIWSWLKKFKDNGNTLILASHETNLITSLCPKLITIERGVISNIST